MTGPERAAASGSPEAEHSSSTVTPQDSTLLAGALGLAAAGWRIFPCRNDVTADGHNSPLGGLRWPKQATTDPETIRRWWTKWPDALIGGVVPPG
ncbi:MAG: bifunctional DNA primase/polymerase, partial [Acidimicrobiia bacterium]